MKRYLVVFLILFLCQITVDRVAAGQKVNIVTGEWEPYSGEKMAGKGFFTEIVSAVFKEMGMDVRYSFVPWKRCEEEVLKGEAFATFPYIKTADREKIFDFSDVVANSTGRFFYMKSAMKQKIEWGNFADLKKFRVGGTVGYWYEKDFEKAGLKADYAVSDEFSFKKLYRGRVDIVAAEELVGWELIKKLYPKEIYKFDTANKPLNVDQLRLMISKKYPNSSELKEKFNNALNKIKANGILGGILKKYNIK